MTEKEKQLVIQGMGWDELARTWKMRKRKEIEAVWGKGKFFEYAIIRAFETEGAQVRYPYNVPFPHFDIDGKEIVEQIDGTIYIDGLSIIAESKDYNKTNIDIEPLAKLQVRLKRRPSPVIGCLFSATNFTWPAMALIESLMPQTILLWNINDINFCFNHHCFVKGLQTKYRSVIEEANHMLDLSTYAQINNKPEL